MALVSGITPLQHMALDLLPNAALTLGSQAMNSNTTRLAWGPLFAPVTTALTALGFRLTTITDGGAMPTYRISWQGLDGSGLPNGTIHDSATFVPTVANGFANNTWTWITISGGFTPVLGTPYAIVVDVSSGTASGTNNISIGHGLTAGYAILNRNPYSLIDTNATWATTDKQTSTNPLYGWKTAGNVYGLPMQTFSTTGVTSTTEIALRWTLPAGWGDTYEIAGVQFIGTSPDAGRLWRVSLYSGGGTTPVLLAQTEFDSDHFANGGSVNRLMSWLWDDGPISLTFGTQYHLGLSINGGTTLVVNHYEFAAAGDMDALPWGPDFNLASRAYTYPPGGGGNVFASSATQLRQRPCLFPILRGITEPAGGGGDTGGLRRFNAGYN